MQTQLVGRTSPTRLKPRTLDLPPNSLTLHWSCTWWSTTDSFAMLTCWKNKSYSAIALVDLPSISSAFYCSCTRWTSVDSNAMLTHREDKSNSSTLHWSCTRRRRNKYISAKLKSNSATASLDFNFTSLDLKMTSVDLSPSRWSPTSVMVFWTKGFDH